ncbi:hypothetical protein YC2023_099796 [Brassica napus]
MTSISSIEKQKEESPTSCLIKSRVHGFCSSNRRPGVRHSTFKSLRLGLSSQSIASGFLRLWDSLNFKKDMEFVGITVLFLDEKLQARLQSGKFKWNDIPTTEIGN